MKLNVTLVIFFLGKHSTKHFLVELGDEKTEDENTGKKRAGDGRAISMRHPIRNQGK